MLCPDGLYLAGFVHIWMHIYQLEMAWIPREKTQQADYLIRLVDHNDWMVNPHIFPVDRFNMVTTHHRQICHSL